MKKFNWRNFVPFLNSYKKPKGVQAERVKEGDSLDVVIAKLQAQIDELSPIVPS